MYSKALSLFIRAAYALSGLAVTFVMARHLSIDTFAYFNSLAAGIAVIMPVLAMGGGPLLIRMGVSKRKNLSQRLGRIQKLYLFILAPGVVISTLTFQHYENAKAFLLIWLNLCLFFYSEMFRSHQRYTTSFIFGNGAASTSTTVQGLASITLLLATTFLVGEIGTTDELLNILLLVSLLPFLAMVCNSLRIKTWRGQLNLRWVRTYFKIGIPFALTGLAFALIAVQELIYLTVYHSNTHVAEYSLIIRTTSITLVIFTILSTFAQPIFLSAVKRIDVTTNIAKIRILSLTALALCCGSTIMLITNGPEAICYFGGENYCKIDRSLIAIRSWGLLAYISVGFASGLLLVVPTGANSALNCSLVAIVVFWIFVFILPLEGPYKASIAFSSSYFVYGILLAVQLKKKTKYSFFITNNLFGLLNAKKNSNRRPS